MTSPIHQRPLADAEFSPIPEVTPIQPTSYLSEEEAAFVELQELLVDFQDRLDDEHELGAYLANVDVPFHLRDVKRRGVLFLFEGVDNTGQDVLAIQHYGQLSLQLVKVRKLKERPARVGFLADPI